MAEIRVKETGTIKLFESDNTSSVTIASPASLGADRTITLPDASVTLASGTMLATDGSGASLTALNASELGSGTVPTARLGSGTADATTFLRGDQTYAAPSAGNYSVHAFGQYDEADQVLSSSTGRITITDQDFTFTPTSTSDIFTFFGHCICYVSTGASMGLILTYSTDSFSNITEGFNQGSDANAAPSAFQQNIHIECKVTGLTADTAYKFRLYAQQGTTDNTYYNYLSGTPASAQAEHSLMGIHYKYEG
jgi:hypothetical protein